MLESMSEKLRIPQIVSDVIKHYNECYAEGKIERCMHCLDCIAFACIYSEILNLQLPRGGVPYAIKGDSHEWNFIKFLKSTITKEYLPCERALSEKEIQEFALALLRIPPEHRRFIRASLICHSEFKKPKYIKGLETLK